ncbi:hypothetical protein [Streptomyces sp. NPDC086989]|uniref:DUF7739 domain-containing protein n=1 Tax=Streptomyces sp. NPDC086989 TaxID=3365764 RepID=UPI0038258BFE
MSVDISHGSTQWGTETLSYSAFANMGRHLAHVLPASDWRAIRFLFDRKSDVVGLIGPQQAGVIADIFAKAAQHPKMPRELADIVRRWAAAGYRAHGAGEMWSWS